MQIQSDQEELEWVDLKAERTCLSVSKVEKKNDSGTEVHE